MRELRGAPVAAAITEESKEKIAFLKKEGIVPTLAIIRIGARADDESYEKGAEKRFATAGAEIKKFILPEDTTQEEWDNLFAVNVGGAFLCARAAVKGMLDKQKGAIINVSSVWGEVGASCESAYAASKAALIGFTKSLAKELGLKEEETRSRRKMQNLQPDKPAFADKDFLRRRLENEINSLYDRLAKTLKEENERLRKENEILKQELKNIQKA